MFKRTSFLSVVVILFQTIAVSAEPDVPRIVIPADKVIFVSPDGTEYVATIHWSKKIASLQQSNSSPEVVTPVEVASWKLMHGFEKNEEYAQHRFQNKLVRSRAKFLAVKNGYVWLQSYIPRVDRKEMTDSEQFLIEAELIVTVMRCKLSIETELFRFNELKEGELVTVTGMCRGFDEETDHVIVFDQCKFEPPLND